MKKINIIEVNGLTKIFDNEVRAVDGISFTMEEGEILGFLGPNGAGKTTTLNMLSTLLKPTSGTAIVNGYDILKDPDAVRRSIGFVFQDPTLDTELTGRENLDFHGRVYGLEHDVREQRIKEMLEVVQLTDRADALVKTYSGGMKRRLEIARGLLHHPKVLFLDEPTLGLDPQTRRAIWEHIERLNQEKNITIILTTHYTDEADYLCGRIQIIDFGKIVALDTAENLKARLQGDIVGLNFKEPADLLRIRPLLEKIEWIRRIDAVAGENNHATMGRMMQMMSGMPEGLGMGGMMSGPSPSSNNSFGPSRIPKQVKESMALGMTGARDQVNLPEATRLHLLVDNGGHRIPELVNMVSGTGVVLESVELHKPTLDDVFLAFTGRNIRDERGSFAETMRQHRIIREARG